jgi:hypothetical protein
VQAELESADVEMNALVTQMRDVQARERGSKVCLDHTERASPGRRMTPTCDALVTSHGDALLEYCEGCHFSRKIIANPHLLLSAAPARGGQRDEEYDCRACAPEAAFARWRREGRGQRPQVDNLAHTPI